MSYIDRNLLTDEKIQYRTKKHIIIFLGPMVWVIVALFCYFNSNPIAVKIAFAPALIALITFSNQLLMYLTSDFAITNKRVMMKEGFFYRRSSELRLTTITNVSVTQSLLGQLLNYGTVIITPFGGASDVFSEISSPLKFQKNAQEYLNKIT